MDKRNYIQKLPFDINLKERIYITTQCQDCNHIKKVNNAGKVFENATGYSYQLMHNGIKVITDGYHGRGITEIIKLCNGHHEPQEEKAFSQIFEYLGSNSLMIELGAHWSYYSLWFQKKIKNAKNIMIEPDENNLNIGKKNFEINNAHGEFIQAYISDISINKNLFERESDNKILEIPCYSVDDFIRINKIKYIDLLHVDIQGWEIKMLNGLIKTINNNKLRFLFLSTHHHTISHDPLTHQKCLNFIRANGGKILCEHSVYESFSGDGLIVASFSKEDKSLDNIEISYNRSSNNMFKEIEYDYYDLLNKYNDAILKKQKSTISKIKNLIKKLIN